MTFEQAAVNPFNPFDITKVWSHADFPLIPVGKLVLNRNPTNYFADIEQIAFSPAHMVPGIEPSPDKLLQVNNLILVFHFNYTLNFKFLNFRVVCFRTVIHIVIV